MMSFLLFWVLATPAPNWDGIDTWIGMGKDVRTPQQMDLSTVPPGGGLALLGGESIEHPEGIRRFVQEGGRVLIAVEGAGANALLRSFDTQVIPAPPTVEHLPDRPALVLFRPPNARVFEGSPVLITNHPVAFTPMNDLEPALRYPDGTPFAYLLRLGEGEVLLVGDRSLFINLMLNAGGNHRFASNVMAWLGAHGPVTVLGPQAQLTGRYGSALEDRLKGINGMLSELSEGPAPDPWLVQILLAMLLAGITAYVLLVFPGGVYRRFNPWHPTPRSGPFERSAGAPGGPAAPENPSDSKDPS